MQARTVPFKQAVRAWWSFTWRWPVLMLVPLIPVSLLMAVVKPSVTFMSYFLPIFTWTIMIWAQLEAMRRVLRLLQERSHER